MYRPAGYLALVCGFFAALAAHAQEQRALEEVVVTAQKREQGAQDVAASLVVLDQQVMSETRDLNDLINLVPNVSLTGFSQTQNVITIRGIGSGDDGAAGDAATAVHYDGIFLLRDGARDIIPYDMARVEILRGPQGTLYGKNAVAGAVNYVPNRPTEGFESSLRVTGGNESLLEVRGVLNGSLSDAIDGRVAFNTTDRDGYFVNVPTGNDIGGLDNSSIRGGLNFTPDETLDIYLGVDYSTDESTGHARKLDPDYGTKFLPIPFIPGIPNTETDIYRIEVNTDGDFEREMYGVTLEANKEFEAGTLTWLSGYRDLSYETFYDLDGSLQHWLEQNIDEKADQFSTELRFASLPAAAGEFEYIAGVYYLTADTDRLEFNDFFTGLVNPVAPGNPPIDTRVAWDQFSTLDSAAIFAEAKYRFNEAWTLIVGGRFSDERKDFAMTTSCGNQSGVLFTRGPDIPVPPFRTGGPGLAGTCLANVSVGVGEQAIYEAEASDSWSRFSGKVGLEYAPNDDQLWYFTFSQGFKSGGFPPSGATEAVAETPFNEELADNFELGARTTLAGGRAFLNAAIFYTDYQDLQVGVIDSETGVLFIENAADATSQGIEIDLALNVNEYLDVFASYAYLDATYDTFTVQGQDASGEPLRGPEHSASLRTVFETEVGTGILNAHAEFNYIDDVPQFPLDPRSVFPSRTMVNAGVSYMTGDGRWEFSLWGRNLTEEEEVLQVVPPPGGLASRLYGPPRTYGITVTWHN